MMVYTGAKIPHHCSQLLSSGLDRNTSILMTDAESEECCNVRVHELVKYQVQHEKTFLCSRNRCKPLKT